MTLLATLEVSKLTLPLALPFSSANFEFGPLLHAFILFFLCYLIHLQHEDEHTQQLRVAQQHEHAQ
jgi:hypothetical protein